MEKELILDKVKDILDYQFAEDPASITMETKFEDTSLDSLEMVELLMKVESEFNICIPDDEAGPIKTVGQLVDVVHGRVEDK